MYHSLTIGNKNTWDDWHLVPTSRPVVNPPKPKTIYVDVPGANGSLDLTETIYNDVVYDSRVGSWEFMVENGHEYWDVLYSNIMNYLHGHQFHVILEDDLSFYYNGRVSVNQWKSDPNYSLITLDYHLDPYKYEINTSGDDWLWDPFDFTTGIIYSSEYEIDGSEVILLDVKEMPVIPTFYTTDEGMKVTYNGITYDLNRNHDTKIYDIYLKETSNVTITGTGTVKIVYRNGVL